MKLILAELVERVDNGEKFHIDFEKRNMKVGKTYLIKDGKYDESKYMLCRLHDIDSDIILAAIEDLYYEYRYSMPSERSERKRKKYFKALPVEELSIDDMVKGQSREVAQAKLEGYILCSILNGDLKWNDDWGTFFWQSKSYEDLVILRKWIEK